MQEYIVLLKSDNYLDRVDAIEYLSQEISNDDIFDLILKCFEDKNYLVRCEAYDAFHDSNNNKVFLLLLKRLKKERSKYARMYLVSTLCGMVKNTGLKEKYRDFIVKLYQKEKAQNVILAYECLIYVNDKDINRIYSVLSNLNSDKYRIRCNVINILHDVIDKTNKDIIEKAYKERLLIEEAYAVRSLLESELSHLEDI